METIALRGRLCFTFLFLLLTGFSSGDVPKVLNLEVFPPEAKIKAFFPDSPPSGDEIANGNEIVIPSDVYEILVEVSAPGFEPKSDKIVLIDPRAVRPGHWVYQKSLRPESPSAFVRSQFHHNRTRSWLVVFGTLLFAATIGLHIRRRMNRLEALTEEVRETAEQEVTHLKQKLVKGNFELENDVIDEYTILKTLGEGAYSRVYQAKHNDWKDLVAIKLLKQESTDEEMLARIRREISIGRELKHPNIVKMFGFGTYMGAPYIVTEFVPGKPLDEVLGPTTPFSVERACKVIQQLTLGLEYAHSKGVVHRDLKPGNLFLSENDGLKILDFGLASLLEADQKITKTGQALGTPLYMSPEQVRGKSSPASDYYALGVIFFELLTGQPPFPGTKAMEIISAHAFKKPPVVTDYNPDVPSEIADMIQALLIKKPAGRLQDPDVIVQTMAVYQN